MKAHYKPDALVYQIGSWQDHTYWGPPELFPADMERPSLYVSRLLLYKRMNERTTI